jgi:hypothetical protein
VIGRYCFKRASLTTFLALARRGTVSGYQSFQRLLPWIVDYSLTWLKVRLHDIFLSLLLTWKRGKKLKLLMDFKTFFTGSCQLRLK